MTDRASAIRAVRDILAYYGEEVGNGKWVLYDVDIDKMSIALVEALTDV